MSVYFIVYKQLFISFLHFVTIMYNKFIHENNYVIKIYKKSNIRLLIVMRTDPLVFVLEYSFVSSVRKPSLSNKTMVDVVCNNGVFLKLMSTWLLRLCCAGERKTHHLSA